MIWNLADWIVEKCKDFYEQLIIEDSSHSYSHIIYSLDYRFSVQDEITRVSRGALMTMKAIKLEVENLYTLEGNTLNERLRVEVRDKINN